MFVICVSLLTFSLYYPSVSLMINNRQTRELFSTPHTFLTFVITLLKLMVFPSTFPNLFLSSHFHHTSHFITFTSYTLTHIKTCSCMHAFTFFFMIYAFNSSLICLVHLVTVQDSVFHIVQTSLLFIFCCLLTFFFQQNIIIILFVI